MNRTSKIDSKQKPSRHILVWLESWEFYENPFKSWDAAREPDLSRYYIKPPFYEQLLSEPVSSLIFSYRGGGKSAALRMLASECRPLFRNSNVLAVPFTDFSPFVEDLSHVKKYTLRDYLTKIIEISLVRALIDIWKQFSHGLSIETLVLGELRYWLEKNAEYLLDIRQPDAFYENVIHNYLFRGNWDFNNRENVRSIGSNSKRNHFFTFWESLVKAEPCPPKISLTSSSQIMWAFIQFLLNLLSTEHVTCSYIYLLIDGVDEYLLTQNDADAAVKLLKPLLGNLRFLEIPNLAVKFFLPLEFKPFFSDIARTDRLQSYELMWKARPKGCAFERTRDLLRARINHFNKAGIQSLAEMCVPSLRSWIEDAILDEAQGNPRNMLRLGNQIFVEHCRGNPYPESEITQNDWERALSWFRGTVNPYHQEIVTKGSRKDEGIHEKLEEDSSFALNIDLKAGNIFIGSEKIPPPPNRQYRLLAYLYRRKGEICSRDEIIRAVYKNEAGISDEALGSLVYRLRIHLYKHRKDEKITKSHYIRTVPYRGYVLDNAV